MYDRSGPVLKFWGPQNCTIHSGMGVYPVDMGIPLWFWGSPPSSAEDLLTTLVASLTKATKCPVLYLERIQLYS